MMLMDKKNYFDKYANVEKSQLIMPLMHSEVAANGQKCINECQILLSSNEGNDSLTEHY